jgi:protein O-mannosyl-transferase
MVFVVGSERMKSCGAEQSAMPMSGAKQSVSRPAPSSSLAWSRSDLDWLAVLCAAIYACYLPVLHFEFVFDDRPFILQNPWLLSWRFVPKFFTAHLVAFLHPHSQGTYYRPCLLLWLLVQRKLWNLNPMGWHFTTLTLHVLASLSVYLLAREILGRRIGAGLAALIFALHPIHVESAAWIMGLPDPLMTLLAVASLLCFICWRKSQRRYGMPWAAASLLLYGAAVLTKEVALTVPPLMFAYEWLFAPEPGTRDVERPMQRLPRAFVPILPFCAVTVAYLAARWAAIGGLSHSLTPLSGRVLVATWPLVIWSHLKLLLWPAKLSAFYDVPYVTHPGLVTFGLPLAAALACAFVAWRFALRTPPAAFAVIWLFLPMGLLLNLRVFPPGEFVHDRFMYFPSVGFSLLLALGLEWLIAALRLPRSMRAPQIAIVASLGIVLGAATVHYCRFWANDWVLYRHALAIAPGSNLATNNLAADLADTGRYQEAMALEQRILARDLNYPLARYNLGYCQYRAGNFDDARRNLTRAITISPGEPEAYVYLGLTDYRTGHLPEAAVNLRRAVEIIPENARYRFTYGMMLKALGDVAGARTEFQSALALDPRLSAAREQLEEIARPPAHRSRPRG